MKGIKKKTPRPRESAVQGHRASQCLERTEVSWRKAWERGANEKQTEEIKKASKITDCIQIGQPSSSPGWKSLEGFEKREASDHRSRKVLVWTFFSFSPPHSALRCHTQRTCPRKKVSLLGGGPLREEGKSWKEERIHFYSFSDPLLVLWHLR